MRICALQQTRALCPCLGLRLFQELHPQPLPPVGRIHGQVEHLPLVPLHAAQLHHPDDPGAPRIEPVENVVVL